MKEYTCFNCDSEFEIKPLYDTELDVTFCPFCGSELEEEIEDEIDDEDYRD